jgi:hypothetical protein
MVPHENRQRKKNGAKQTAQGIVDRSAVTQICLLLFLLEYQQKKVRVKGAR